MDLGLLLFGVMGMAYGLANKPTKTEISEPPKIPDCPPGYHYEFPM